MAETRKLFADCFCPFHFRPGRSTPEVQRTSKILCAEDIPIGRERRRVKHSAVGREREQLSPAFHVEEHDGLLPVAADGKTFTVGRESYGPDSTEKTVKGAQWP